MREFKTFSWRSAVFTPPTLYKKVDFNGYIIHILQNDQRSPPYSDEK